MAVDAEKALRPHLPRLVLEWIVEDPAVRWRAVEGTVVFADLSGFTRMSERLSRHGRVGAEEVTESIGACFSELLFLAYADGGGLLQFGGDALLLLFTGPDHAVRAARSAVGMRARLRTVGRLVTTAGNVTLRMSMGVHSGCFHAFLVGGASRLLVLAGRDVSTVVAMESAATAGRIVVSDATAARLPRAARGARFGPGVLLARAPGGPAPVGVPPLPSLDGVDLRGYVPTEVRAHALAGVDDPEHRTVTASFVQFGGLDDLLDRCGPDRTAAALDELVATVEEACDTHGVALLATDVGADGGKLMLASGAPRALGNPEDRMLAVVRSIVEADTELPVRVGVHRGPVFAGDVGPPYRKTYTVMGDTVNLTARLMAAAAPGQILTTRAVLDRAPRFEASALSPISVKGKRAPVEPWTVGPARRVRAATASASLPFVGRDGTLRDLVERLEPVRGGQGAVVEIVGPEGIGKSRLVDEVRREASGFRTVAVVCEPYDATAPYAAVWWLLHRLLDLREDAEPGDVAARLTAAVANHAPQLRPWLPLLAVPLDLHLPDTDATASLSPQFRRERTVAATVDLVAALLTDPTMLTVEDTQWLDEASREVVARLVAQADRSPWLVMCTRPPTAPPIASDVETLVLGAIDEQAAREALRRATQDDPMLPHVVDVLVARADGNPLFLGELLRAAREAADIAELPDSVESLLTAELDRLAPHERRWLRYAAVLGRGFSFAELDDLLAADGVDPADRPGAAAWSELASLVDADGTRGRFRHGLIRDVAYQELSFRRRRELHALAAANLERALGAHAENEAELLSVHFLAAREHDRAWQYACLAGRRACERYANHDAATSLERALAAARHLPHLPAVERADVLELLGDVRERVGAYDAAASAYRGARTLVREDPVALAALLLKQAWIPERTGRYSDALRWIRKGLAAIDGVPGVAAAGRRAHLASWFGTIRQAQGRSREALEWCERAIADARAAADRDAEAHACITLDWAYYSLGRREDAVHSARALALYEELGDLSGQARVHNNLGGFAYWAGEWDAAVAHYERARDLELRTGDAVNAATATANLGEVLSDQGHLDAAEEQVRDALRVFRAARYGFNIGFASSLLGRIAARRGDFAFAHECYGIARRELQAAELPDEVVRVDAWTAEAHALAGEPERAIELASAALARVQTDDAVAATPLLHRVRASARAQLGDDGGAAAELAASLAAARDQDAAYEVGLTLAAQARLTGDEAVAAESREILQALGVVGAPVLP